jgi:hypothetical protein
VAGSEPPAILWAGLHRTEPAEESMDRTLGALVVLVALVLVGGFVTLALTGRPTDLYVLFVSGPMVSALVGGLLTRKVAAVQAITETVAHQTNGILTGRLDSVDNQLQDASDERTRIANPPPDNIPSMPAPRPG